MVLTTQLGDNRRLLLEAQMQQDMRTAADLISRDLRRAGYWTRPISKCGRLQVRRYPIPINPQYRA